MGGRRHRIRPSRPGGVQRGRRAELLGCGVEGAGPQRNAILDYLN